MAQAMGESCAGIYVSKGTVRKEFSTRFLTVLRVKSYRISRLRFTGNILGILSCIKLF